MNRTGKRPWIPYVWASALLTIILVPVLFHLVFRLDHSKDSEIESSTDDALLALVESSEATRHNGKINAASQFVPITLASLDIHCPEIWNELSSECFEALDKFFMDSILPFAHKPSTQAWQFGNFWTFRNIFEDPGANLSKVVESLSNPECRRETGGIRLDLRQKCGADVIAAYALFTRYCEPSTISYRQDWFEPNTASTAFSGKSAYQYYLDSIESKRDEDLDVYTEDIQELKSTIYREAWLEKKCSDFGSHLLRPLSLWPDLRERWTSHFSKDYGENLSLWPENAKTKLENYVRSDEYRPLVSIAARLGSEWAIAQHFRSGPHDEAYNDSVREIQPWLPHFAQAMDPNNQRFERVENAIKAIILADQNGIEIDKQLFVKELCQPGENAYSCNTVIGQIEYLSLSSRQRVVLDEIQTTWNIIQLGL